MPSKRAIDISDQTQLLKFLLAIELWRGGLSQAAIRTRLGLSMNTVNAMLKGLKRTGTQSASD